jgi:HK97 family phage portal protein
LGLLTRMVTKNSYSMDDFDKQVRQRIQGGHSHTGIQVSEESAMKFITVYSCVRVLAETISSLPLVVFKTRANGKGSDKATDHKLYDLLYNMPNDEMQTTSWRAQQIGNQAISGNCYSVITENKRGQPIDIYPLMWTDCRAFRDMSDGVVKYQITDRGKHEVYPADKIFHVACFGADGITGFSPIRQAAGSIGTGMAASEFIERFYGQGMNLGGVLELPGVMTDIAFSRLKEDLDLKGSGLANSWKPLILEEGAKYNRIPMPLSDAQFIETRKFTRDDICGLLRVPPHMIANLERSTNNNIEQQSIEFVQYSLLSYLTAWEKTISWKLLSPAERKAGYYVKHNVAALLRGDYKTRQEGLATMRQNGIINANGWLELEDMNPIDGIEGEAYLVNGTMIPTAVAATKTNDAAGGGEKKK